LIRSGATSVCPSSGESGRGAVGRDAERFASPRGFAPVTTELTAVETMFGDEAAALDEMLSKNES
jgi:hypothetical protein